MMILLKEYASTICFEIISHVFYFLSSFFYTIFILFSITYVSSIITYVSCFKLIPKHFYFSKHVKCF